MNFTSPLTINPVLINYLDQNDDSEDLLDIDSSTIERLKRPIIRKDEFIPVKRIALRQDDAPVVFKIPYKPSKKEFLSFGEFMCVPVSGSYTKAKQMALYLHEISIKNVRDFRTILLIFNHSSSYVPKKSKIKFFLFDRYDSACKNFTFYNNHLTYAFNTQIPVNVQDYLFKEHNDGVSMVKREFPLPFTHRIRILKSTIEQKTFYSVILKKKEFEDII